MLDWKKLIVRFQSEIHYASRTIGELISENAESHFCGQALKQMEFANDPRDALRNAGKEVLVNGQDRELFCGFVNGLGTSDTESQLNHIALYASLLEERLKEAQSDCEKKFKLYTALGLFSGIAICIILL